MTKSEVINSRPAVSATSPASRLPIATCGATSSSPTRKRCSRCWAGFRRTSRLSARHPLGRRRNALQPIQQNARSAGALSRSVKTPPALILADRIPLRRRACRVRIRQTVDGPAPVKAVKSRLEQRRHDADLKWSEKHRAINEADWSGDVAALPSSTVRRPSAAAMPGPAVCRARPPSPGISRSSASMVAPTCPSAKPLEVEFLQNCFDANDRDIENPSKPPRSVRRSVPLPSAITSSC